MGKFDILKCKIVYNGEEVLFAKGQIGHYIIAPEFSVLVTGVKCKEGLTPPYEQWNTLSFSEFAEKSQKFKSKLEDESKDLCPNLKMQINLETTLAITD